MPDSQSAAADFAHAEIGIVCALPIELGAFLDRCQKVKKYSGGDFVFRGGFYDGIRIAVVESGMGFARARRATQALIEGHTPRWLLSCGFAGALCENMPVGSILVADSVVDQHGQSLQIDLHMPADPARGLFVGRLLTADDIVRTVDRKRELAEQHSALAVDQESLAVAQVARDRKTRFLAVRVISDDLSADLPAEILSIVGATGSVRFGAAVGALWKRPSAAKDMWRLREQAQAAATKLATFLDGVVVQLHAATKAETAARAVPSDV